MRTSTPSAAGEGQLVIDVVDGSTRVERIKMVPTQKTDEQGRSRYEFIESPELLCETTPCAVNLPLGNVVLAFPIAGSPGAKDVELIHIDAEQTVYRRALTYYKPQQSGSARPLGIVSMSLGGMAMVTGAALLPIGLSKDKDGLASAGLISLGAGAVLTALGIWSVWGTGSTYRPGSAIHYSF